MDMQGGSQRQRDERPTSVGTKERVKTPRTAGKSGLRSSIVVIDTSKKYPIVNVRIATGRA
jgi:hypothetical protein